MAGLYWLRHEYSIASESVVKSSERLADVAHNVRGQG